MVFHLKFLNLLRLSIIDLRLCSGRVLSVGSITSTFSVYMVGL